MPFPAGILFPPGFRTSPPGATQNLSQTPPSLPDALDDMDAPEISTLREEEEESPPPDGVGLSFSKFRVNMRIPSWGQSGAAPSGSAVGPPVGPLPAGRRGPSPPDSEEEDEEDQLIDDDELAVVTETGRGLATSSPASMVAAGSPTPSGSPRKRGASRVRQRRPVPTGRRGRPGREPPDAAAMMSTFEVLGDPPPPPPVQILPPTPVVPNPPPVAGPSAPADWTTSTPPKPPRKKPGPKKGTTLGPRGPRKTQPKWVSAVILSDDHSFCSQNRVQHARDIDASP